MMLTLINIFRLKCPVCGKGEFLESRPRLFFKIIRVRDRCSSCQTGLKIEPSFYYGSMYVSYALGVGNVVYHFYLLVTEQFFFSSILLSLDCWNIISFKYLYQCLVKSNLGKLLFQAEV